MLSISGLWRRRKYLLVYILKHTSWLGFNKHQNMYKATITLEVVFPEWAKICNTDTIKPTYSPFGPKIVSVSRFGLKILCDSSFGPRIHGDSRFGPILGDSHFGPKILGDSRFFLFCVIVTLVWRFWVIGFLVRRFWVIVAVFQRS